DMDVLNGIDFHKGCFIGQEVISRVENRGRPSQRLVGLRCEKLPDAGAAVFDAEAGAERSEVGEVTRAVESPSMGEPIAFALVEFGLEREEVAVEVDDEAVAATVSELPFVEGSGRSARIPRY
ncbi:MAG: glycine cleavage T C-terminal barrel domain-containing protein, partial [Halalkalicoccus sp.]